MNARNEHGRQTAEAIVTPVALVSGASPVPNAYPQSSDRYLVVEVAGDIGGSTQRAADDRRWGANWRAHLSRGEVSHA